MGVCARARGFCADAGARAGAHTCLRAYVRAGAREYVRVCENAHMLCVRARVSACRCASVPGRARIQTPIFQKNHNRIIYPPTSISRVGSP